MTVYSELLKFSNNADPDKYGFSSHGIGFDALSDCLINAESGKSVIIFCGNNSSSVHTCNTKKEYISPLWVSNRSIGSSTITA